MSIDKKKDNNSGNQTRVGTVIVVLILAFTVIFWPGINVHGFYVVNDGWSNKVQHTNVFTVYTSNGISCVFDDGMHHL